MPYEILLSPQVPVETGILQGASQISNRENQEPDEDGNQNYPRPERGFFKSWHPQCKFQLR